MKLARLPARTALAASLVAAAAACAVQDADDADDALPEHRKALYNWRRGSKVFLKRI